MTYLQILEILNQMDRKVLSAKLVTYTRDYQKKMIS